MTEKLQGGITSAEFVAWLEGFLDGLPDDPLPEKLAMIRAKAKTVDKPIGITAARMAHPISDYLIGGTFIPQGGMIDKSVVGIVGENTSAPAITGPDFTQAQCDTYNLRQNTKPIVCDASFLQALHDARDLYGYWK